MKVTGKDTFVRSKYGDIEITVDDKNTQIEKAPIAETKDKHVDGGQAWIVLAAASVVFCIVGSTMKGLGIFFNGFIEEFGSSSSVTAIIPGVLQGTYSLFTLPVLTIGLRYFSTRQLCIISGFLSSAAFIGGSFASAVEILIITNGVMIGIAFAFAHGPLMYLNGIYFVKRRNLAICITVSAFSFGGVFFPPIYSYLIDLYGLRGGSLITGGILLHIIGFALLLRPKNTEAFKEKESSSYQKQNGESKVLLQQKIQDDDLNLKEKLIEHDERERSNSESCLVKKGVADLKLNSFSEVQLNQEKYSSNCIDKLSNSNVTRLLGGSDIISMSLSELHDSNLELSQSSLESDSNGCSKKLKFLVDFSVFNNWFMCFYFFVYCFGSIGSAYVIIFIAPFAKDSNLSSKQVASLVSIVNFCDFFGRLMSGIVTDRNILKNHQSVVLTLFLTTVCLALSPFYTKYWHFILFAIVSGLCAGGIFALTPSVVADFLGMENFRSAMGILVLGQGVTLGLSAPFIGYLRDISGTYVTSFYFMACCELVSVTIFIFGFFIQRKSLK